MALKMPPETSEQGQHLIYETLALEEKFKDAIKPFPFFSFSCKNYCDSVSDKRLVPAPSLLLLHNLYTDFVTHQNTSIKIYNKSAFHAL